MTLTVAETAVHRIGGYRVRRGQPAPFGARCVPGGINFAVFFPSTQRLSLVLCHRQTGAAIAELPFPEDFRTGHVHTMTVLGLTPESADYGYRVTSGQADVDADAPLLLDPYGTEVAGGGRWGERPRYRSRIAAGDFDWADDRAPMIAREDLVLYELHVRGFTRHPSSGVSSPGTFDGLREKIPYLRQLGVNCVELLPIAEFDETDNTFTDPRDGRPLLNYWGYNPLALFTAKTAYAGEADPGTELKRLVRALHQAGIGIVLDVVFNHTGEGGRPGPTVSFRGLGERVYYLMSTEGEYLNLTATGNTVNCNHPVVRTLIVDCLRHWVLEYHVDGFRFDMAPILSRGTDGVPMAAAPLVEEITHDPILAGRILIAEPWDADGVDQAGRFAEQGSWMEWNGRYRDAVRRFLTGMPGTAGELATRLIGSPDLFGRQSPAASVNFVTCHDGFTLADWVAYRDRHNTANGEDGSDGIADNLSDNHGVEGPAEDQNIVALRRRQVRNALALLLISSGTPMLLGGDEFGRTQQGNNNAYAQDNEISWVDWNLAATARDLVEFVRRCLAFRRAHPVLRHPRHPVGDPPDDRPVPHVSWHGTEPWQPDWASSLLVMMMQLHGTDGGTDTVLTAVNGGTEPASIRPPDAPPGTSWHLFADTAARPGSDAHPPGRERRLPANDRITAEPRSVLILTTRKPSDNNERC